MQTESIGIVNETKEPIPDISWGAIKSSTEKAIGRKIAPWSAVFILPEKSRKLNSRYRDSDKPTNILSFSGSRELLICPKVLKKEAHQMNLPQEEWLTKLVIHGVLHLEGYVHEKEEEAKAMEALEQKIFKNL